MRREIKFRGKRVDNKEWVYGYFFKSWDNCYILHGTVNGVPVMVEVNPETVGQFTGLKDKNGVEIYEGDIVRHRFISNGILETSYNEVYFDIEMLEFGLRKSNELFHCQFGDNFELIGNIHDNPELLK